MPAAMTSEGVIAGRHLNVVHRNGSCSCFKKLRRRTQVRTPGTVIDLFSGRSVVPQGPVKWSVLCVPYPRPRVSISSSKPRTARALILFSKMLQSAQLGALPKMAAPE